MRHLLCRLVGFGVETSTKIRLIGFPPQEWGFVTRRCLRCGRRL